MNGCTIPYTPIAVDLWKQRKCAKVSLHFLSHVELDQSCGLSSNWMLPIYCSPVSKKLLIRRFQVDDNLIHALDLDIPHAIPLTPSGDVSMTVTLVDARHCPGAVMFLFDGYFGRILYTGNFRYEEGMLDRGCLSEVRSNPVDVLYIDNTFCSPKCVLPSRQEAKAQLISIIEQHPRQRVVFGFRGLGKADELISLAKRFDVKITISEERYRLLEVLALHEQFVVASEGAQQTRFEMVELVEITRSNVDAWNKTAPTIAVLLTGLFVGLGYQPFVGSSDIFVVPLSDHSPFAELHEFVAQIRPKTVVPIVRTDPGSREDPLAASLLDRTNVECFVELLDQSPMRNYHIPPSVLEMMNHSGNARSQTRKQTSTCCKTVSSSLPVSNPGQTLLSDLSPLEVLASISAEVTSSDAESERVRCKRANTRNVPMSDTVKKPHVAVRPMKRCLPPERRHSELRFTEQRQHHCVSCPASFELRQSRFRRKEMLQQERAKIPVHTCRTNSHVLSVTSKPDTHPDVDAVSLTQCNDYRHGIAVNSETGILSTVPSDGQVFQPFVENASLTRMSWCHAKHTVSTNAVSATSSKEMSARQKLPQTWIEVDATLDNNSTVIADDTNAAAAAAFMVCTGLPRTVDACNNHMIDVLPDCGSKRAAGTNSVHNKSTCKQNELQRNDMVSPPTQTTSLPPKKKWRKRFRAAQLHHSHQENCRQMMAVSVASNWTARRSLVTSESNTTCHVGHRSVSSLKLCPIYTVARRVPLLTNYSCAADDTSKSGALTSCRWSTKTIPHATDAVCNAASDCAHCWHASLASDRTNRSKRELSSSASTSFSKREQQKSATVTTLPLDLSVCRKSAQRDCGFSEDALTTISDAPSLS